jgi:hypothetical protein
MPEPYAAGFIDWGQGVLLSAGNVLQGPLEMAAPAWFSEA